MAELQLTTTATIPSGASIEVYIIEDTGSTTNINSQVIDNGSNVYTVTGFDASSENNIKLDVEFSPGSAGSLDSATVETVETSDVGTTGIAGVVENEADNRIGGATVELIDQTNGDLQATTTTDSNGFYEFTDVNTGDTYHVAVRYTDANGNFQALSYPFITVSGDVVSTAYAQMLSRRANTISATEIESAANTNANTSQAMMRRNGGLAGENR